MKYVEPIVHIATKTSWKTEPSIWTRRVCKVVKPKPFITMEANYTHGFQYIRFQSKRRETHTGDSAIGNLC
jgi:hypothetical protein